MQNTKDVVDVNKLYGKQCLLTKDEFIKEYNVNENGLNEEQVVENIRAYGKNEVTWNCSYIVLYRCFFA